MTEQQHRLLNVETIQDVLVLTITEPHVEGDLIAEQLRVGMIEALGQYSSKHAVIDLQHIQYISSAAFRPLLVLRRALLQRRGRLVLCGLNRVVGDIFYSTRMIGASGEPSPMFEIQPGVTEAVAFVQKLEAPARGQP